MATKSAKSNTKTTRKTTSVRKTIKKVTKAVKQAEPVSAVANKTTSTQIKINKSMLTKVVALVLIVLLGIILIDYVVQLYFSTPAAIVDGERISYTELDQRLRESAGEETLENLINEEVVLNQADKKGLKITDAQIEKEYKDYADSFPGGEEQLLEQLDEQNINKEELLRRIRVTLMVNQLVKDRVKAPTEEEVRAEFDERYSYLEETNRPKYEDVKGELKEELKQRNLNDEIPEWLEEVKGETKIQNNLSGDNGLSFLKLTQGAFRSFLNAIGAEALSNSLFEEK